MNQTRHQQTNRQAERFRARARLALLQRRKTICQLAAELGRPRESVGRAINGEKFPKLRAQIAAALSI